LVTFSDPELQKSSYFSLRAGEKQGNLLFFPENWFSFGNKSQKQIPELVSFSERHF
jgi:hypothetical protein